MFIPRDILQVKLPVYQHVLTYRQVSNFAAATQTHLECYFDDTQGLDKLQIHPVFPVVLSWKAKQSCEQALKQHLPQGALAKMIHQQLQLTYFQPIKATDSLQVETQLIALEPHNKGALLYVKYDIYNQHKQLLVTELSTVLLQNTSCEAAKSKNWQTIQLEQEWEFDNNFSVIFEKQITIPKNLPYQYDAGADIHYPVHTSPTLAQKLGFKGIILQGSCALALITNQVIYHCLFQNPSKVKKLQAFFRSVILPPQTILLKIYQQKNHPKSYYFQTFAEDQEETLLLKGKIETY